MPRNLAHDKRTAIALIVLALWFVVSWPVGLIVTPERLSRPGEVSYLIADVTILLPLALATAVGLLRQASWAPALLLVTAGAFAYDVLHFGVHTLAGPMNAPLRIAVLLVLLALLGLAGYVVWKELPLRKERRGRSRVTD